MSSSNVLDADQIVPSTWVMFFVRRCMANTAQIIHQLCIPSNKKLRTGLLASLRMERSDATFGAPGHTTTQSSRISELPR